MTGRLEGKAALITGSSKGIGKGIAEAYLEQGASVFLCARGEERLAETAEELASRGEVAHLAADAVRALPSFDAAVLRLAGGTLLTYGRLTLLGEFQTVTGRIARRLALSTFRPFRPATRILFRTRGGRNGTHRR